MAFETVRAAPVAMVTPSFSDALTVERAWHAEIVRSEFDRESRKICTRTTSLAVEAAYLGIPSRQSAEELCACLVVPGRQSFVFFLIGLRQRAGRRAKTRFRVALAAERPAVFTRSVSVLSRSPPWRTGHEASLFREPRSEYRNAARRLRSPIRERAVLDASTGFGRQPFTLE